MTNRVVVTAKILADLLGRVEAAGRTKSLKDIAAEMGLSYQTAYYHINRHLPARVRSRTPLVFSATPKKTPEPSRVPPPMPTREPAQVQQDIPRDRFHNRRFPTSGDPNIIGEHEVPPVCCPHCSKIVPWALIKGWRN